MDNEILIEDVENFREDDMEFEILSDEREMGEIGEMGETKEDEEEKPSSQEEKLKQEKNKILNCHNIFSEFIADILNTFPEYTQIVSRWWTLDTTDEETKIMETNKLMEHCERVFPERFFDILYKNETIFSLEEINKVNTEFLPGIVFKHLWNLDISEHTKNIIWHYLQLILFLITENINKYGDFKDTAKLFEFIGKDDLKQKLEETFVNMEGLFKAFNECRGDDFNSVPNPEDINNHINSLFEGKLGKLAMELTEEIAKELSEDLENLEEGDSKKVFEQLLKNPAKMMDIVKNIGNKIDEKIKSGEFSESELMSESAELLQKLKNTNGLRDLQKMFSQFNIPGLSKETKVNVNAMESQLNKNIKNAKMKERIKAKLEAKHAKKELEKLLKKQEQQHQQQQQQQQQEEQKKQTITDEELVKIFRGEEKQEKTPRFPKKNKNKNKK